MTKAIVVPFGVPEASRGLGLGLVALLQHYMRIEGDGVAVAQLLPTNPSDDGKKPQPIETFVPPSAWDKLRAQGDGSPEFQFVITGAFDPPNEGPGTLQLLAFDAKSGEHRASLEANIDVSDAGQCLFEAIDEFSKKLGGDANALKPACDLNWDALECVLWGERCQLFDPTRRAPFDRSAAMAHFGRAMMEAPESQFIGIRLANLALDAIERDDPKRYGPSAERTLARAIEDAPTVLELREALAAACLRLGRPADAEAHLLALIGDQPNRTRPYALLAVARRSRGDLEGARAAVTRGMALPEKDPLVLHELGTLEQISKNYVEARTAWGHAVSFRPLFPPAFVALAAFAVDQEDRTLAESLVDRCLDGTEIYPVIVLGTAAQLAIRLESDGVAKWSRVKRLTEAFLAAGGDQSAWLSLARAEAKLGEQALALAHFEKAALENSLGIVGAEAQAERFQLTHPVEAKAIEDLLRRAESTTSREELLSLLPRAKHESTAWEQWTPALAYAIVARRLGKHQEALHGLQLALRRAPGLARAREMSVETLLELNDATLALTEARELVRLAGESPERLGLLARVYLKLGEPDKAREAVERSLSLDPENESGKAASVLLEKDGKGLKGLWRRVRSWSRSG